MKKTTKLAVKEIVKNAVGGVLDDLKVSKPSKKTKKALKIVSKALRADVEASVKKAEKIKSKKLKAIKMKAGNMDTGA